MKFEKLTVVIALVILFFFFFIADTFRESAGKGNFALSLTYEDLEFDNDMKTTTGIISADAFNNFYRAPLERRVLILRGAYGIFRNLDIFAGIGYSDEKWTGEGKTILGSANDYKQTGEDAVYEAGFKGTAFEFFNDQFYLAYLSKYSYTESGDKFSGPNEPTSSKSEWEEFVVELEVGCRIQEFNLTPYAGVSYFDIKGKQYLDNYVMVDNYDSEFENSDDFGYFFGISYEINNNLFLNAEGMFEAKEGFKIGLEYKF